MDKLIIYEDNQLSVDQPQETALLSNRKRRWPPSAPAPLQPQMEVQVVVEEVSPASPPPPLIAEVVVEEIPPRIQSPPPSPSFIVKCESASSIPRPCQSLLDDHQLFYGSEPDPDESDEDYEVHSNNLIPKAQRCFWETPLDIDDADDQPAAEAPAPAPVDANTSSIPYVPPSATDQPWGLYEFDWKPFPNVPIPPESRREMFSHNDVGPTAPCVDPYEIFISIWDRQFMEYIASETNRYAQQLTSRLLDADTALCRNSRMRKWRDTTADELYVYFAVVIAMGVVVKSRIEEYWNATPDVFYTPGFSAHMSGHRFSMLSKCLHFVNNHAMCELNLRASEAKLFKVQPLLSHLNDKFQSLYRLGQNIVLDESLLQWKGCLDISQLIPNKAATVGIKTYEICESQTGYLWRFEIHSIKSQRSLLQQFEDPIKASTPAIVLRLIQGLEGKGHTLWMDNFYNSPCLARRLKVLGFDCVGTLRTNRKFVPQALHSLTKANMTKGQIAGLTSGDVDVMVWRDNDRVAMISTYHGNGVSRARDSSTKPILINDYNIIMGGVDKKDQMLALNPIERERTKVWYKKLFRRLLNVSVLNSYIIHRQSFPSSTSSSSHRNFRICLVKALLSKHCPSSPTFQPATTPSMHQNTAIHDARIHYLAEYPFGAKSKHQRQRRKCANVACRKQVHTYCVGCDKAMCLTTCFLTLHP